MLVYIYTVPLAQPAIAGLELVNDSPAATGVRIDLVAKTLSIYVRDKDGQNNVAGTGAAREIVITLSNAFMTALSAEFISRGQAQGVFPPGQVATLPG